MVYSYPNEEVTNKSSIDLVVHHPKLGIALKERMDQLGIECIVQYRDANGKTIRHDKDQPPMDAAAFIRKHFEKAKSASR